MNNIYIEKETHSCQNNGNDEINAIKLFQNIAAEVDEKNEDKLNTIYQIERTNLES